MTRFLSLGILLVLATVSTGSAAPIPINKITEQFYVQWPTERTTLPWTAYVNEHSVPGIAAGFPYPGLTYTWPLDTMPDEVRWGIGPYHAVDTDPMSWIDRRLLRVVQVKSFTPESITLHIPLLVNNPFGGATRVQWTIEGFGLAVVPEPSGLLLLIVGLFTLYLKRNLI